ncbi:MAG: UDP-3-O-(3-hydroxymyristoyl)glucosamine N-acyltransferase [Acidobacteriaceae bacterium]|nr:UDP-3-O-(3-hydroxymyristoyl)glucosamine N-acyltransferase [Acidobacteriaceae bacterium]MBV9780261.1 UDP-3-O-(3-hydroxymyristoyl)glucosamine N-acyltransferase [Acidobacteriaceae bacterium]
MPHLTVAQLADICGGQAKGNTELLITGASALEDASATELSFVGNQKAVRAACSSRAGCLLVPHSFEAHGPWALIRADNPRAAFSRAVGALFPKTRPEPAIHPTANVALTASVASDCFIGAYVSIGEHARIAPGCVIGNGCVIGDRVTVGERTILHANVTVYENVQIGSRVIIHSGAVLAADGFGFTLEGERYEKFPQIGTVEIGDDVEIGANCCIDRAALGATRIGEGAKLDNMVHVAHNCSIGKHVVVAAQTGFSGGVVVGDYAVIGGQAGVGENAKIEPKAIVGGKSGILPSQKIRAGEPVWGIPARPLRQHLNNLANVTKLPEMREELRQLKQELDGLKNRRQLPEE